MDWRPDCVEIHIQKTRIKVFSFSIMRNKSESFGTRWEASVFCVRYQEDQCILALLAKSKVSVVKADTGPGNTASQGVILNLRQVLLGY